VYDGIGEWVEVVVAETDAAVETETRLALGAVTVEVDPARDDEVVSTPEDRSAVPLAVVDNQRGVRGAF
jgi:hypothetical protein